MAFFKPVVGGALIAEEFVAVANEELIDADHGGFGGEGIAQDLGTGDGVLKTVRLKEGLDPLESPLERADYAIFVAGGQLGLPAVHPSRVFLFEHGFEHGLERGFCSSLSARWAARGGWAKSSGVGHRLGVGLGGLSRPGGSEAPDQAEEGHEQNDSQGGDAVDAVDFKDVFLDVGEVEGEAEAGEGEGGYEAGALEESEAGHGEIAGDADGGDGDVEDLSKWAVVDYAAVPLGVDVAGLGGGGVMDLKSECGDQDAGQSEDCNEIAHLVFDATRALGGGRVGVGAG